MCRAKVVNKGFLLKHLFSEFSIRTILLHRWNGFYCENYRLLFGVHIQYYIKLFLPWDFPDKVKLVIPPI